MEAINYFETSLNVYSTKWCHITEDSILYTYPLFYLFLLFPSFLYSFSLRELSVRQCVCLSTCPLLVQQLPVVGPIRIPSRKFLESTGSSWMELQSPLTSKSEWEMRAWQLSGNYAHDTLPVLNTLSFSVAFVLDSNNRSFDSSFGHGCMSTSIYVVLLS
jgi:hypothetical protein